MIDLSYLTEEEQEVILNVLKRDAELKKAEGARVKQLQKVPPKECSLKNMTGEWFYEVKSKRHRDTIHGSDIIVASMKQAKPKTPDITPPCSTSGRTLELSSKPSVNTAECTEEINNLEKSIQKDHLKKDMRSPKLRHNPFNSESVNSDGHLMNGTKAADTSTEPEPSLKHLQSNTTIMKIHGQENPVRRPLGPAPVPKKRTMLNRTLTDSSGSGTRTPAPRIIHKQNSSRSSADFQAAESATGRGEPAEMERAGGEAIIPQFTDLKHSPLLDADKVQMSDNKAEGLLDLQIAAAESKNTRHVEAHPNVSEVVTKQSTTKSARLAAGKNQSSELNTRQLAQHQQRETDTDMPVYKEKLEIRAVNPDLRKAKLELLPVLKETYPSSTLDNAEKSMAMLAEENTSKSKLTEAEGESIAKVLEWFSRSSDNSNREDDESSIQDLDVTKEDTTDFEDEVKQINLPVRGNIYSITPRQGEGKGRELDVRLFPGSLSWSEEQSIGPYEETEALEEDNALSIQQLPGNMEKTHTAPLDKEIPCSEHLKGDEDLTLHDESHLSHLRTMYNEKPPKIAGLKSFWERENIGPKILISRSTLNADIKPINQGEINPIKPRERVKGSSEPKAIDAKQGNGEQGQRFDSDLKGPPWCTLSPQQDDRDELVQNVSMYPQRDTTVKMSLLSSNSNLTREPLSETERHITHEPVVSLTGQKTIPGTEEQEDLFESSFISRTKTPVPTSSVLQIKQDLQQPEGRGDKIRQLRSFWENERVGPKMNICKSKDAEFKLNQSPVRSSARLNKRFTKSAFDLRSTGLGASNECSDSFLQQPKNFSMGPGKDKNEKSSISDAQFKNLRDFWGGAPSFQTGPKSPSSKDRPHKPKGHLTNTIQLVCLADPVQSVSSGNCSARVMEKSSSRVYRDENLLTKTNSSKEHASPALPKERHRNIDRWAGSSAKRSSVETKSGKSSHKSVEPDHKKMFHQQSRRNSEQILASAVVAKSCTSQPRMPTTGNLNERAQALRRATSMHVLSAGDVHDQTMLSKKTLELNMQRSKKGLDISMEQSRKEDDIVSSKTLEIVKSRERITERRPSRTSEDSESQQVLARSFIPRDYQHYLGISNVTDTEAVLDGEELKEEICTSFSTECDCSRFGELVRSSTPLGSDELTGRRESGSQRPGSRARASEGGQIGISEPWSTFQRNPQGQGEDDGPLQKALRRAATRPAFIKSLEDLTSLPRQEKESAKVEDFVYSSNDEPSPPTSSLSDPEHMKKMSKSVPSFLHKEVSGSAMSVYSGDFGGIEVQGTIQFTLNYLQKLREFHIFVVQCKNLAAVDSKRNRSDPYVKSYLIPDKANLGKRKTSVKKKTISPVFNEILRYRVRMDYLKTQTLNLSVWHHDTFGRNCFLGEVEVDLSTWDFGNTQMNYLALKSKTASNLPQSDYRGEMRLAVRFLPPILHSKKTMGCGEVHIWVKDCKNLPVIRSSGIDPYVKCFVLPDTSRKSRQKTRVLKKSDCPVFNHTMVYDGFQAEDLREACVELTVWDRDRLASHLLGGLRLGLGTGKSYGAQVDWMDSTTQEVSLWERMMRNPNDWVEDLLPLRMLNKAKTQWK
ncbi:synaptotagmin-like protein 2 isoform X2 [Denticeps clupeoides]|uniref:Synaptotagmin-like protein 2 n=1 Tax=Denticeps clupeoides TaxID=299321 RepID=A0AAY4AFB3_9TELE|nr:synaptotagmin-like protein 2 isoform X2 [Denticeps clupeoides]